MRGRNGRGWQARVFAERLAGTLGDRVLTTNWQSGRKAGHCVSLHCMTYSCVGRTRACTCFMGLHGTLPCFTAESSTLNTQRQGLNSQRNAGGGRGWGTGAPFRRCGVGSRCNYCRLKIDWRSNAVESSAGGSGSKSPIVIFSTNGASTPFHGEIRIHLSPGKNIGVVHFASAAISRN